MIPKFRAYWIKDSLITAVDSVTFCQGGILVSDGCSHEGWVGKDVILEQSTGLFDTNGEEIFEGDIVRLTFISNLPMVKEVKRIPSNGGTFPFCNYNPFEIGKTEIIGNIHENPELLNEDFVEMRMREVE